MIFYYEMNDTSIEKAIKDNQNIIVDMFCNGVDKTSKYYIQMLIIRNNCMTVISILHGYLGKPVYIEDIDIINNMYGKTLKNIKNYDILMNIIEKRDNIEKKKTKL